MISLYELTFHIKEIEKSNCSSRGIVNDLCYETRLFIHCSSFSPRFDELNIKKML